MNVVGFDLLGHGRSDGKPGYVDKFDKWKDQGLQFFDMITRYQDTSNNNNRSSDSTEDDSDNSSEKSTDYYEEYTSDSMMSKYYPVLKTLSVFAFGQGMGASIALHVANERYGKPMSTLSGVLLSAPLIEIPSETHAILQKVAKGFSTLTPHAHMVDMHINRRCHSELEIEKYKKDALCHHFKMRARVGCELLMYTKKMKQDEYMIEVNVPFLILHGTEDNHCAYRGSQRLHDLASSVDKKLIKYSGFYNDLLHELCCSQVCIYILLVVEMFLIYIL
jgi:alpha-beta hydrolase superfamily lysophospholipase